MTVKMAAAEGMERRDRGIDPAKPRFAVADMPAEKTMIRHIDDVTGFRTLCRTVRPRRPYPPLQRFALPQRLLRGLRAAVKEAIATYGLHGWLSSAGRAEASGYESLSLTYNPDLEDAGVKDVHQSTLGTSMNQADEFFYGTVHRFSRLKHTYFDTYGFRLPTPAARIGALGRFLDECRLSLVRSRLSVLYGDSGEAVPFADGWHRDESVFENLRINIPLVAHRNYQLQMEHERETPDESSQSMSLHYLRSGYAYTLDTNLPHRVFASAPCRIMRVHLVLGFSPWFDYDADADAWCANEFYGRTHPFDILREGLLHPALREDPI